jgi:pyruvate ferredoxin oxidoreductase gamma subunit
VFQVRIHGRGGQGVVTAAELLSEAAFAEGHHAQAFPSFGSERTGAPVVAFCRVADTVIRVREPVMAPDALIVQDETLLEQVDVFAGLLTDGYVLINSTRSFTEMGLSDLFANRPAGRLITVPATELALEHLGRPMPNAVLLGAFSALTQSVTLESVSDAIRGRFPKRLADKNCVAAEAAYSFVQSQLKESVNA